MPIKINTSYENDTDLFLIEGESREVRSNYYQRLVKYSRQLIRALNAPTCTLDIETYCYAQLWLTRKEMDAIREKYYLITEPRIDDDFSPPTG